tara:strand:- start:734 stop:1426 length:693 start_codon:yes stop_codon:yes gene_type:complete
MNIQYFDCGFPYITIDDLFTHNELDLIWEELNFLTYSHKLLQPRFDASQQEKYLAAYNNRIFLDELYGNSQAAYNRHGSLNGFRDVSNILSIIPKIYADDYKICKGHDSWFFKNLKGSLDYTCLSYYENGNYYMPHSDSSLLTTLIWLYKEPKKFDGGDLFFPDYNTSIKVKNNVAILFPSMIQHGVDIVNMKEQYQNKKMGRYCITNFLHVQQEMMGYNLHQTENSMVK